MTGARTEGIKGLRFRQIVQARSLYQAVLDPRLDHQIRKGCPHLLDKE
ncbi:MAG: hypothetical protein ACOCW9_05555 [Thermodesulfobacteriota bacterium]